MKVTITEEIVSIQPEKTFEFYQDYHDVSLRILLVDDKVGGVVCKSQPPDYKTLNSLNHKVNKEPNRLVVSKCPPDKDCAEEQCKLCTIKRLMDAGEKQDGKNMIFKDIQTQTDYFYWDEKDIECYYCNTILEDFINEKNDCLEGIDDIAITEQKEESPKDKDYLLKQLWNNLKGRKSDNTKREVEINCDFKPTKDNPNINKMQIVGVRDVRTALLLLSRYKFDMLFFDYLLEKKENNSEEREYSTQFFEFL